MKTFSVKIVMFTLLLLSGACNLVEFSLGRIKGDSGISYNDSKVLWEELKTTNGNSYNYTIRFLSFAGFGSNTTITVTEGVVTERRYEAFEQREAEGGLIEEIVESYVETGADIGTHEEGAEALNIDELYDVCISKYLVVSPAENTVYFNTWGEGVISTCGYVPDGCMDDCFIGFEMSHFEWM
ncbi:MAG: hypothetical protein WAM00_06610 [Salegentibacter sp.]